MTQAALDPFEQVIRESGQGWLIDLYAPKEQALPNLRQILLEANARGRKLLPDHAPTLTPESLITEYRRSPHKVRAFLQVIGAIKTPDILVMVWRILQGLSIAQVTLVYEMERSFHLTVRLRSSYEDGDDEIYESHEVDDAVILRHIGIMKMSERPIFDGFYPLNLEN